MQEQQVINVLKGLVIDGVNKSKSGHPGGAMSSMDFAYVLFKDFLKYDPRDPKWLGRDRFILSAGHESMLLYSFLHIMGWLPMEELKNFRQLHSKTPGHPENILTPGVECTTGPLGQGAAMSVGFAIAAQHCHAALDSALFNYKTYALLGDGCMQEDVTLGAASLAGHLKLNNLIWYYDRNRCQISGKISRTTSDDETKIFTDFGWKVVTINGHDRGAIRAQLKEAQQSDRPFLIIGDTVMAHGAATLEGEHKTHGEPFPAEERIKTKVKFGLPQDSDFYCPEECYQSFRSHFPEYEKAANFWREQLQSRRKGNADFDKKFKSYFETELDPSKLTPVTWPLDKPIATRNAFGDLLKQWAHEIPNLIGGSADLEPSNMTGPFAKAVGDFQKDHYQGRNLAFGVREFPMSAIANGIALHGGLIPFDATFLSFADYSRAALRLGSIQQVRVIHEFTHDSFYLGEDGPTHQPIEHVMSLRLIPDFYVMRPADGIETQEMTKMALCAKFPSAICLSRQKLPFLSLTPEQTKLIRKGGYVLKDAPNPKAIMIATGSEVSLALETCKLLSDIPIRIVSMPCWELFFEQDKAYQTSVLPDHLTKRISIEAGATLGWQKITGNQGINIGIDHFGASAPMEVLAEEFGFTPTKVAEKVREMLK